jgi:crotonobetainyl-CoA:carnitine CoA-transferase CaiB-like acyl-CoA transferase
MTDTQPLQAPTRERLPLEGVKVVDLATLGAGPWLATRLSDFGADVVKIERPGNGDPLRQVGPSDGDAPLWWKAEGRNKRCVTVDLKTDEGREIVRRLAADADVLIENFRPGTLERWGLDYESLSAGNPRLIMVRVTGWGQDGPYRDRTGFGTLAEAISGWAHLNGYPDTPPTLPPFALGDAVTALLGSYATMVALYERDVQPGGRGQVIDLAIYESLFSLISPQVILHDRLGIVPQRVGNAVEYAAPRNIYRTGDGQYVTVVASTQGTWERVAAAIDRLDLLEDPRFADNPARMRPPRPCTTSRRSSRTPTSARGRRSSRSRTTSSGRRRSPACSRASRALRGGSSASRPRPPARTPTRCSRSSATRMPTCTSSEIEGS